MKRMMNEKSCAIFKRYIFSTKEDKENPIGNNLTTEQTKRLAYPAMLKTQSSVTQ